MKTIRRWLLWMALIVLITITSGVGIFYQPFISKASAQSGPLGAFIAVQFDPGWQEVRSIAFSAPISGLEALQLSGYSVETVDFGGGFIAVCSINGVGCPAANCFCDPDRFWNYEYWDGSQWTGYLLGAADSTVDDGAIEGWRWSEYGVGALPAAPQMTAAAEALEWLAQQQSADDGGYGGFGVSLESLFSIRANGYDPIAWRQSVASPSLLKYIYSGAAAYSRIGASNAGKLALGLAASDACLPFQTVTPLDYYDPSTGQFSTDAGAHAWAMLGSAALNLSIPEEAVTYIQSLQKSDGGWEWTPGGFGGGTDTNTTSLAIQALIAAGEPTDAAAVTAGLGYLGAAQNNDGGFPYDPDSPYGTASDANSTAYAVQAIAAAGGDLATWSPAGASPADFLLSLQLIDGSFEWQEGFGASLMATQQAIPALLGRSFPLKVHSVASCPTVYLPLVRR